MCFYFVSTITDYTIFSPQSFEEPKLQPQLRSPTDKMPGETIKAMFPGPDMIHPLVFPMMLPQCTKTPTRNNSIMQPTHLDLIDFVNLFRSFSICSRKDLKDLFEQFATTTPHLERRMPRELLNEQPLSRDTGEQNVLLFNIWNVAHKRMIKLQNTYRVM